MVNPSTSTTEPAVPKVAARTARAAITSDRRCSFADTCCSDAIKVSSTERIAVTRRVPSAMAASVRAESRSFCSALTCCNE